MKVFSRSLWPAHVDAPYRRLAVALLTTPILLALVLSLLALIPANMVEPNWAAVLAVAIDTWIGLTLLLIIFAGTVGILGVGLLWAFGQRGFVVWVFTGLIGGTIGGLVIRNLYVRQMPDELMVLCAFVGVVFFATLRTLAGVQPDRRRN